MTVVNRSGRPVKEHKTQLQALGLAAQAALPVWLSSPEWFTRRVGAKQGQGVKRVKQFIDAYHINISKAQKCNGVASEEQCIKKFKTLNELFTRQLAPRHIRIAYPRRPDILVSQAQCRLMVFQNFKSSGLWVKGKHWSLERLLGSHVALPQLEGAAIAVFRLAPQDYHRVHTPTASTITSQHSLAGSYLSVDPTVIAARDVFTENHRVVLQMRAVFGDFITVMVGAAMVGTINVTAPLNKPLKKGADLGNYSFGGSTNIMIIPRSLNMRFSQDLLKNSRTGKETYVQVGDVIGQVFGS